MTSQPGDPTNGPGPISAPATTEWLRNQGPECDVVMSSRVRLARNIDGFKFCSRATPAERRAVLHQCRDSIVASRVAAKLLWVDVHAASVLERTVLAERHLISQQHARGRQGAKSEDDQRGVAFSLPDERLSIMVNEEDHLRLQMVRSGLMLDQVLTDLDRVDDALSALLPFAFSERFGYLTTCPTNVGTGIRLSVMLHLPGLRLTGDIEKVKRAAADMALAVRGFHGEGSEAAGDLFQISNQTTLGKAERALLAEMQVEILPRVIEYERAARRKLMEKRREVTEDQIHRAVGTLSSARLMTTEESMQLLSLVRLGAVMGVLEGVDVAEINLLMLVTQPAHIQRLHGSEIDQDRRLAVRAAVLRDRIRQLVAPRR